MNVKSLKPFNAMGVISAETGETLEIESPITVIQLEQMGFIKADVDNEETPAKKTKVETKKAK